MDNGHVGAFIKTFCERYRARFGATYHVLRSRDVPLTRALLKQYPADHLARLADILFEVDDAWVRKTDRGIGILSVRASWLDLQRAAMDRECAPWRLECRRLHGGSCSNEVFHAVKVEREAARETATTRPASGLGRDASLSE